MSIYRRFARGDVMHSVVYASPRVVLASGTGGWRGNTGVSASLSLYGGVRGRSVQGVSVVPLDPLDTHSIDKVIFVTGSYPSTGSVRLVTVRRAEAASSTQVTSEDWYREHFGPVERLFDYYSQFNSDYFTGSYDFYCLHLRQNQNYSAACVWYSGSTLPTLTSSFTMEAHVKPLAVTSSLQDFTILSQRARFKLYVTGSTGRLVFTDFGTVVTSSAVLTKGVWQHVAVTVSNSTASLFVDLAQVASVPYTGTLAAVAGGLVTTGSFLTVGAEHVISGAAGTVPFPDRGYRGFIYETRVWDVARTQAQLSASAYRTLDQTASSSANLRHYSRFNDGPLATAHGLTQGSGVFEYGREGVHGQFKNVNTVLPLSPTWHPNDDIDFTTYKTAVRTPLDYLRVVHVPSLFYGRQIATGSVELVCNAYNRQEVVRVIHDDGRGSLYVSGSVTRGPGGDDYKGVVWNKVGNVFYSEGLIVVTDPSLLDIADASKDWTGTPDVLQVSFRGLTRTPTKTLVCRMAAGDHNCSNNTTFHVLDDRGTVNTDDDRVVPARDDGTTYVTAVGIYDDEHRLVAVAKLAQPIRKREKDKNTVRLRYDL